MSDKWGGSGSDRGVVDLDQRLRPSIERDKPPAPSRSRTGDSRQRLAEALGRFEATVRARRQRE